MNKFVGLFIAVIALATLAGAAIGWRFPFLGQNRTANQVENQEEAAETGAVSQAPLRASQPNQTTAQAPNTQRTAQAQNTQTTAQAPQTTVAQESPATTESAQPNADQPIPALW